MEEKHRELLQVHRSTFVHAVDAERLSPILKEADVLGAEDLAEISSQTTKEARVEKLLSLLPSKGSEAFQNLCLALETTYPHILTVMFLGGSQKALTGSRSLSFTDSEDDSQHSQHLDSKVPQSISPSNKTYTKIIPSCEYELNHTVLVSSATETKATISSATTSQLVSGQSIVNGGDVATKANTSDFHLNQKYPNKVESYRITMNGETRLAEKNRDYDWLKSQCERAMNELQSLKRQHGDTVKRCDQAVKEADTYRANYKTALTRLKQLTDDIQTFKGENLDLNAHNKQLKQKVMDMQKLHEEDKQEIIDLHKQHREVINERGSNEVLNKMYDTALGKYEALKKDYDSIRQRYADLIATHSATCSRLENANEEVMRARKSYDDVCAERDSAVMERNSLKQQCTAAIRNWDQALREVNKLKEALAKVTQQRDETLKEMTQSMTLHSLTKKELDSSCRDRDAALREYSLIMSERDTVHKEIEQLQDKLAEASKRIEILEEEKKTFGDEISSLQQKIVGVLEDRDKAVKEYENLCEKYHDVISDNKKEEEINFNTILVQERELAEQEHRNRILQENYEWTRKDAEEMEQEREMDSLKKQVEKLQHELNDALQEAELAKKRRDWAFGERDKIVQERESIRNLCDSLRRDRDRAVSDLAQALRELDELKKQKNEAYRELKEIREKYDALLEKETRKNQLNSVGHNHSRDSAIDADMVEWETETLEIDLNELDTEDLGFDFVGGTDDPQFPNDNSIFVGNVTKGSAADGKLKVNDIVIRVNSIDVTSVEKQVALEAVRNSTGVLNMVVRRRKSATRLWQPVQLNLSTVKDLGIQVEGGLFISWISAGSTIAKEGMLNVGDRLSTINGQLVSNMSAQEVMKMLEESGESVILDVWRQVSPFNSNGSSPTPVSQSVIPTLPEQSVIASSLDRSCLLGENVWDSGEEEGKSIKNVKHSGSQTDSLDSPKPVHWRESKSADQKFIHSTSDNILEKAWDRIRKGRHNKYQERQERDRVSKSYILSKAEEDVIAEFDAVINGIEKINKNQYKNYKKKELEQENSGTWPKYRGLNTNISGPGTVMLVTEKQRERPLLSAVLLQLEDDSAKSCKIPPLPPERTISSFVASMQHSPQNSETIYSPLANTQKQHKLPYISQKLKPFHMTSSKENCHKGQADTKPVFTRHSPIGHAAPDFPTFKERNYGEPYLKGVRLKSANKNDKRSYPSFQQVGPPFFVPSPAKPSTLDFHSFNPPQSTWPVVPKFPPVCSSEPFCRFPERLSPVGSNPQIKSVPNYPTSMPVQTTVLRQPAHFQALTISSHRVSSGNPPLSMQPLSPRHSSSSYISSSIPEMEAGSTRYYPRSDVRSSLSPPSSQLSYSGNMDRITPTLSDEFPYGRLQPRTALHIRDLPDFSGCSTFPKHGHERIRIPSNISVTTKSSFGKISTSSMEVVSERSSPMSSMFPLERSSTPSLIPPLLLHSSIKSFRKPSPGETRSINIEKTSEPVGFQIESGQSGGIFVSSITEGSLAAQAGLEVGDQLLEVCGINMRNATYQLAANVLRQCRDNFTMLVQYNPQKYKMGESSDSNSCASSSSNSPESPHKQPHLVSNETLTSSSPTSPQRKSTISSLEMCTNSEPRVVFLEKLKSTSNLGISIIGGNGVGVFVDEVQSDSVAAKLDGLRSGDQILEFNGVDLRTANAEQARRELSKASQTITILAQYNPSNYNQIKNKTRESFYIQTHFDRPARSEKELGFKKDDILYVENTYSSEDSGMWLAWRVDDEGNKVECGMIPSKMRLEPTLVLKRSRSESLSLHEDELKGSTRRGSATVRRSFFKRKKHQRNNSKDSRELNSFSDISLNDSSPILDDGFLYTYTKVERKEYNTVRPVVFLAPLAEPLICKLTSESPDRYSRCNSTIMKTTAQTMEKGQADGIFIEYHKRDDCYECIAVSGIKEICDKNCHCLLNISPAAIERLHRLQIYPIVIYTRHKSAKQIREVKDVQFLPDKISSKNAKELFEQFQKIEEESRHLFPAVVQGGNLAEMCMQIKRVIDSEQQKVIWISSGPL